MERILTIEGPASDPEAMLLHEWPLLDDGDWLVFDFFGDDQGVLDVADVFLDCCLGGFGKIAEIDGKISELIAEPHRLSLRKTSLVETDNQR